MAKNLLSAKLKMAAKHKLVLRPKLLLSPNIPRPMHNVVPREILGQKWWNETRKEAYHSTLYHCVACGVSKREAKGPKWLEGHEHYNIDYLKGRMTYLKTVPLCHYCHNFIHDGRMQAMLDSGELPHKKYASIMQHGAAVLKAVGKVRYPHEHRLVKMQAMILNGLVASWKDWRLVLFGKQYPPKYKTEEHWRKAMSK